MFVPSKPKCPVCGHLLSGAMPVDGTGKPTPGDVTVCIECLSCLTYTKDMQLQFTLLAELPPDVVETVVKIRIGLMAAKGWNR